MNNDSKELIIECAISALDKIADVCLETVALSMPAIETGGIVPAIISTGLTIVGSVAKNRIITNHNKLKKLVNLCIDSIDITEADRKWCASQIEALIEGLTLSAESLINDRTYISRTVNELSSSYKGDERDIVARVLTLIIGSLAIAIRNTPEYQEALEVEVHDIRYRINGLENNYYELRKLTKEIYEEVKFFQRLPSQLSQLPPYINESLVIHRSMELDDLFQMLQREKSLVLLHGFGGVGKTSLAKLLLFRAVSAKMFDSIGWISYSKDLKNSLLSSIVGLYDNIEDEDTRWNYISNYLRNSTERKLLFIDNVDSYPEQKQDPAHDKLLQDITSWLNMTVIITSRLNKLKSYTSYELKSLSEDDCIDLFYFYYDYDKNREKVDVVKNLLKMARYHTFTIELIAKAANFESCLEDFCKALLDNGFSYPQLEIDDSFHDDSSSTIQQHLRILFNMSARTMKEKQILWGFSVIPLLYYSKNEIEKWMNCSVNDLQGLVRDGWLELNNGQYSMHSLVRDIIFFDLDSNGHAPNNIINGLIDDATDSESIFYTVDSYSNIKRKIDILKTAIIYLQNDNTETEILLNNNLSRLLISYGSPSEAIKYQNRVVEILENIDVDDLSRATIYNNLGCAFCKAGNYKEALNYHKQALKIMENASLGDNIQMVHLYLNLSATYSCLGDYESATKHVDKALDLFKKQNYQDDILLSHIYDRIGSCCEDLNDYSTAKTYFESALSLLEENNNSQKYDIAVKCNNVANCYNHLGQISSALKWFHKAIRIFEEIVPQDHSELNACYNNIGMCFDLLGEYSKSEIYKKKAINNLENGDLSSHPKLAFVYNSLGTTYFKQQKYDSALVYLLKSLSLREKLHYDKHPDMGTLYADLSATYGELGNFDKELFYALKSKDILEIAVPSTHISLGFCYNNVAYAYDDNGNYEEALEYITKAYFIYLNVYGFWNDTVMTVFSTLKRFYLKCNGNEKEFFEWLNNLGGLPIFEK